MQLLATHFGLAVKPCPLRPSSSAPAGPRATRCQRAHPHPRATLSHVVDITHASRFPHTTHLINIKKNFKTTQSLWDKDTLHPWFHICPMSFFSFSQDFLSVQFSRSVVSDSLEPHESQHAWPPCPSPSPGVHSNHSLPNPKLLELPPCCHHYSGKHLLTSYVAFSMRPF